MPSDLPDRAPPQPRWDPPGTTPHQLPLTSMIAGIDPRGLVFGAIALLSAGPALVVIIPIVGIITLVQYLQWQAFRYGFDGQVVRVHQGVLQRRHRSIDAGRVQQVEIDQPVVHRLFGLAVVRIETASEGGETEVELDGVRLAEAEWLRAALRPGAARAPGPGDPATAPGRDRAATRVLEVPMRDLAISAVTGAQLLALPAALAVLAETVFDIGAEDDLGQTITGLAQGAGIALVVVLVAAFAFLAAVVASVLRDGGYRVDRRGDDIVIRRGMLTSRETVLPRHRIQVVEVRQNWLRRALGIATVHVRSAGGGAARDDARRIQVPLIRPGPALDRFLAALLPEVPPPGTFRRHPPAARRRSIVRATLQFGGLAVPVALVAAVLRAVPTLTFLPWEVLAVATAALLVLGPFLGLAEYGHLAHALGDRVVASRHGVLGVTVAYAPLRRLQGVTQTDSLFQRRLGLASVAGHLAGAGATTTIVVHDVGRDTAGQLRLDLTTAAAGAT